MLYDRAKETSRPDDPFSQEDLLDLDVIPNGDKALLLRVIQALSDEKLFVTMRDSTGIVWKWRDEKEAEKYEALDVCSFPGDGARIGILRKHEG